MGRTITEKVIETHLVSGRFIPGNEIGIRIDQTLTQDATGTMAYLQFESLNIPRVKTELSVSYIDHNTVQIGFENADDRPLLAPPECSAKVWYLPLKTGEWYLPSGTPREIWETSKRPDWR